MRRGIRLDAGVFVAFPGHGFVTPWGVQ
jgi:hypothetical protein